MPTPSTSAGRGRFQLNPGQGSWTIVLAISLIIWARFARVVHGEVLAVKARDFGALARVHGCSSLRIMAVHIVPNVLNTFMVLLTLHIGFVIIVEASLSFLGAALRASVPGGVSASARPTAAPALSSMAHALVTAEPPSARSARPP